jgi:hypothetical protein
METSIVSKLSLGTMGIKGAAILGQPEAVKNLKVATIYGKVGGFKKVEDKLTGNVHFPVTGNFVGINHINENKEFASGLLYLPAGIHDQLLDAAKKLLDESDAIDFALEISAVRAGNAAGYSYEARPLVKPRGVDPLESLRASIPGLAALTAGEPVKQIEAPATSASVLDSIAKTHNTSAKVAEPAKVAAKR